MAAQPDRLDEVIADAWRVFDLPKPATTGVCVNCCMDPGIEADFLNHPARDLPLSYIRDWFFAAFTDDLGFAQMGWLLPRILELLAAGEEVVYTGNEVALARLPRTGFPENWPAPAVAIVNRFARGFLSLRIAEQSRDLDMWLCMFGEGGVEMPPLLALLDELDDAALADLLHANWFEGSWSGIPFDAFWSREPARSQVWAWYTSAELDDRMARAGLAGNAKALQVSDLIARSRE